MILDWIAKSLEQKIYSLRKLYVKGKKNKKQKVKQQLDKFYRFIYFRLYRNYI